MLQQVDLGVVEVSIHKILGLDIERSKAIHCTNKRNTFVKTTINEKATIVLGGHCNVLLARFLHEFRKTGTKGIYDFYSILESFGELRKAVNKFPNLVLGLYIEKRTTSNSMLNVVHSIE